MSNGRLNTKLEAEGAEFLVLGHVLIENVECSKAYTNYPGYDLIATSPQTGKVARIQVKMRWATNRAGFFAIDNLDCDFVVHVALNRGERRNGETVAPGDALLAFYVFPIEIIRSVRSPSNKINIRNIPDHEQYRDAWPLISASLKGVMPSGFVFKTLP